MPTGSVQIFHGDVLGALDAIAEAGRGDDTPVIQMLAATLKKRLLLRAATEFEGWVIHLARWVLQAAATGLAGDGVPATELLRDCRSALHPSFESWLALTAERGVVRRADAVRALEQCAHHQQVWKRLLKRGTDINAANRFGWTALHYSATFGSKRLVKDWLSMGASATSKTFMGQTPLHLAAVHAPAAVARVLVDAAPQVLKWRDAAGRSPADLALSAATDALWCCAMLQVLQSASDCDERCDRALRARAGSNVAS
eukprot:1877971-Prymnesium_polylepis.2